MPTSRVRSTPQQPRRKPMATSPIGHLDRPQQLGNPRMGWVSDVVAEVARAVGLKYMALVPGASYRGFHDSVVNYLGNRDPQMVLCLDERHAVAIAEGYGKITDEPMAVALHANVGLMNASLAIFNAWGNRTPMVIFGANGPLDAHKRRPWIEWSHTTKDNAAMVRHFIKWDDEPQSPQAAVESLLRANQFARTPPMGPVYVCLDAGLQELPLADGVVVPDVARFRPAAPPAAPSDTVRRTLAAIRAAKFPLLLVGRVSRDIDAWNRRIRLAEALGAAVYTTLRSSCSFPTEHPLHVAAPGSQPTPEVKAMVRRADVILSLDWVDLAGFLRLCTGNAQTQEPIQSTIINCSLDSYLANGWNMDYQALPAVDLPVLADPDAFVAQLLEALPLRSKKGHATVKPAIQQLGHWTKQEKKAKGSGAQLTIDDVALCIGAVARRRKLTLARVARGWPAAASRFVHPLDFLGNDGAGELGSGPGRAVGAALALKGTGRIPVGIMGDGNFAMGVTALWTASRMDLPLLIVVDNNRNYHNDETHQHEIALHRERPAENRWIGIRLDDPALDIGGLARAQGFEALEPVTTKEGFATALDRAVEAVSRGGRYVIDARTNPGAGLHMRQEDGGRG